MGKIFNSILSALSGGQLVDAEEKLLAEISEAERVEAERLMYTKEAFEDLNKQYEFNVQQLQSRIGELSCQVSKLESTVKEYEASSNMVKAPMYSLVSAYMTESHSVSSGKTLHANYIFRHNITGEDILAKSEKEKGWYSRQMIEVWDPEKEVANSLKVSQD